MTATTGLFDDTHEHTEDDDIYERFALELYAAAGDDGLTDAEVANALSIFRRHVLTYSAIDLWQEGLLSASYRPHVQDIAFTLTDFGAAMARIAAETDSPEQFAQVVAAMVGAPPEA